MADNGGLPATIPSGLESVDPKVLQTITLLGIAGALSKLIALTEEATPEGQAPFFTYTATALARWIPLDPPWFSIQLINDGANQILLSINDANSDPIQVNTNEKAEVDFGAPRIQRILVISPLGAACRIWGTR